VSVRVNLISIAAMACLAFIAGKWISARASVPADPSWQSDFLRIYDPVPLLNSFLANCAWKTGGAASEAAESPGYLLLNNAENVWYTRIAQTNLCDEDQYPVAVDALHRSALSALHYFDCQVSSDNFSAGTGVRIVYHCGTRTAGLVTTGPKPQPGDWPPVLTLRLEEEWMVRSPS
jgi:hypothetical protein